MRTRLSPLDFVALAALACYGLSVLPFIPREVSTVTGPILCFGFTGFLAASAILPHRTSTLVRFTAVVACSLGIGIVGGLILNFAPSGLTQVNWVTYGLVTTLIAYGVARARGADIAVHWSGAGFTRPSWAACAKVLASVVILTMAIVVSATSTNSEEKTFTELWLVPDNPGRSPLRAVHAELGVKSHESSSENFVVVVNTGMRRTTSRVTLAPNQVWLQNVVIEGAKASAELYRGDESDQPYRTVWIAAR